MLRENCNNTATALKQHYDRGEKREMTGDILAWILGIAAAAVLIAGARSSRDRREKYHRDLIEEFSAGSDAAEEGEEN